MRFVWTIGRVTLIDFSLFKFEEDKEEPDVVVVHHYKDEEEDNGPDLFGKGQ